MEALPALAAAQIPNLASAFYYIPNFITEDEEAALLAKASKALSLSTLSLSFLPSAGPKPLTLPAQITSPTSRWTNLTYRRLQVHPAPLTASNILLLPTPTNITTTDFSSPLPQWLLQAPKISTRFSALGVFTHPPTPHGLPNHCLINEYPPGVGIMPHEDGAAYAPVVATVSLGSSTVLEIYDKHNEDDPAEGEEARNKQNRGKVVARILQEPRSLLVTRGEAYQRYLHGIKDVCVDEDLGPETVVNWEMLGDKRVFILHGSDGDAEEGNDGGRKGEKKETGQNVRGTRISLTFRDVLKVKSMRIGIGGGAGFLRK